MAISVETLALAKRYTRQKLEGISGGSMEVVENLPSANINPNTTYLLVNAEGSYDQWRYIDGDWRKLGGNAKIKSIGEEEIKSLFI